MWSVSANSATKVSTLCWHMLTMMIWRCCEMKLPQNYWKNIRKNFKVRVVEKNAVGPSKFDHQYLKLDRSIVANTWVVLLMICNEPMFKWLMQIGWHVEKKDGNHQHPLAFCLTLVICYLIEWMIGWIKNGTFSGSHISVRKMRHWRGSLCMDHFDLDHYARWFRSLYITLI